MIKYLNVNLKRTALICIGVLLISLSLLPVKTSAYVDVTEGTTTNVRAISVLGNPDAYPYEYYNSETGKYEGVFPDILEVISEKSGIDFLYVYAGASDEQLYRSKEGGAELITAFYYDEAVLEEYELEYAGDVVNYDKDEGNVRIGFAFTSYLTESVKEFFLENLENISDKEILEILASYDMVMVKDMGYVWIILGAAVTACIVAVVIFMVITTKRRKKNDEEKMLLDPLTGLGNKDYFSKRFDESVLSNSTALFALAFIGFDIVRVNGYYGEDAAELQLKFLADNLHKAADGAADIAARVTGGGFVLMHACPTGSYVTSWIDDLLRDLNAYMKNYEKDYKPTFHAGVFYMQSGYRDKKHALANAQRVYQYAMEKGLPYYIADAQDSAGELIRSQLKKRLSSALISDEFRQFFQPVVDTRNGRIIGVEALSRWYHPDMGILNPQRFVELMEEEGTIMELDLLIFERACAILEKWEAEGCDYFISTNFTRSTISSTQFKKRIWDISDRYKFTHSHLIFEITEDCIEDNIETATNNVKFIRNIGFRIALDDLGSGYTFFSDFTKYPIDVVKLDRNILIEAESSQNGRSLAEGIVYLCKNMGFKIFAEGVENAGQYELVNELGCDGIQGFYFYRAMSESDFEELRTGKKEQETIHE